MRKNANIKGLSVLYSRAEASLPRTSSEKARDIPDEGEVTPVIFSKDEGIGCRPAEAEKRPE